jgi:methylmalonyl-CoA/ethylmalonyl-CoA epimerase
MKIDHICFAVSNLNEGIAYWKDVFGYRQMTEIVENSLQEVMVVFMCKDDSITVKLIEPLKSNQSLVNYVSRGGGFHHLCFRCSDIDQQITDLKEKGLLMLAEPAGGEAFNNKPIAFMLAKYKITVELIDTDEKAGVIV